jgi:hypothetical protein
MSGRELRAFANFVANIIVVNEGETNETVKIFR